MGCCTSAYEPGLCEVADNTEEEMENMRMNAEWRVSLPLLPHIYLSLPGFWVVQLWFKFKVIKENLVYGVQLKYGDWNKIKLHPLV